MDPSPGDVTVFAIDDHRAILDSVTMIVAAASGFRIVGVAESGAAAADTLDVSPALDPDLILIDLNMPGENGIDAARHLMERGAKSAIVLMSTMDRDDLPDGALAPPIRGFLPKSELSTDALERVWAEVAAAGPTD
ncbi:MAG: response regulator [Actinomycetota bacterium]